jgi:hypothetical protein
MTLKLDAGAQSTIQRAVDDIEKITNQSKGKILTKEQNEKVLDDYSDLSGALMTDPAGTLALATSGADLTAIILDSTGTDDVKADAVQDQLSAFITDINQEGGNISLTDDASATSSATPMITADSGGANNTTPSSTTDATAGATGDSTTVAGLQAQIVALEAKLATAKPEEVASIRQQEQALMVQQQAVMNGGSASSGQPAATPVTAPVSNPTPTPVTADSSPTSTGVEGVTTTPTTSTPSSSTTAATTPPTGSYGGGSLTQAPGPGEAIPNVSGTKAYGPSPQGPQPGRPYPYIGKQYSGPASNFPDSSKWMDFDSLFSKAKVIMKAHGDTDEQIDMIKNSIQKEGSVLDPRVILCLMMKESGGALGVGNTTNASGTASTGLLQADGGTGYDPSNPQGSIDKMIKDGIEGVTPTSTSILAALKTTGGNIYEALRGYNSGLYGGIKNLDNLSHSPASGDVAYVSNFANYLTDGNFV